MGWFYMIGTSAMKQLTDSKHCSGASIAGLEQLNARRVDTSK